MKGNFRDSTRDLSLFYRKRRYMSRVLSRLWGERNPIPMPNAQPDRIAEVGRSPSELEYKEVEL